MADNWLLDWQYAKTTGNPYYRGQIWHHGISLQNPYWQMASAMTDAEEEINMRSRTNGLRLSDDVISAIFSWTWRSKSSEVDDHHTHNTSIGGAPEATYTASNSRVMS